MKVKMGMFMTDARGKVGGHVVSKNRGGLYVRTKVTPTNAQTIAQQAIRGILGSLSQTWSQLEASQILSWNNAVDNWVGTNVFGDTIRPSGKSLYVQLNTVLAATGQAQIDTAPVKIDMPILGLIGATLDISSSTLILNTNTLSAGYIVALNATSSQTKGTSYVRGRYRRIGFAPSEDSTTNNFYSDYVAKFGAVSFYSNIFVEAFIIAPNGQVTVLENVKVTVQL